MLKPQLEAACFGLKNIHFLPLQPFERLSDLLAVADIHLLPQSPEVEDLVLPSKLSGMLASGRPVIATCRAASEIAKVISTCGVVVAPENGTLLADAIQMLSVDPAQRKKLGAAGRRYAEENIATETVLTRVLKRMQKEDIDIDTLLTRVM